jgi:hypothetical protein
MQSTVENPNNFVAVAISQDGALIWREGLGNENLPIKISPPIEIDHRHVRTGQFQRGHDTAHRYPEYFEEIANSLRGFSGILIIGHGHGKGSAALNLLKYLKNQHPDLHLKVIDNLNLNLPALSEAEIRMHARQWFEENFRKLNTWHGRQPSKWF